ncbi:hypothetical protein V8D89_012075 [Ganoderma adspersum]
MAPSTPDRHAFLPFTSPNKCTKCMWGKGSPYHINPATTFFWMPPTFTSSLPVPDVFSDVPDDPDYTGDLESEADASDDEGVLAYILTEFEETTCILDDLCEYADQAFKALPNPAFTHPPKYAMHLMKVGFNTLRVPPNTAPSPLSSPPFCINCNKKETEIIPPACVLTDTSMQTTPPPPPLPARVLMDAAAQTLHPQHAESQTLPPNLFCMHKLAAVMATSTLDWTAPAPAPSPPPTLAWMPMRSTSPCSSSTYEDFNKVLACLTALRKKVSPPPSLPPTPWATSLTPRAAGKATFHLTIAVPYGIHSLMLNLAEQVLANNLYGEFLARIATANARAHLSFSTSNILLSPPAISKRREEGEKEIYLTTVHSELMRARLVVVADEEGMVAAS